VADGPRALLYDLTSAALAAVEGRAAVRRALAARPIERPCRVVAIGKAAPAMALGAVDRLGARLTRALVVTKQGHATAELAQQIARLEIVESGHPMPNAASLTAGTAVLRAVDATPADELLLFLISGGASSLADVLAPGIDLELLARANAWLLGSGLPIGAINAVRARLSQLKGGQLASRLGDRPWRALMISDVPRDDPAVIGSGLLMTSGRDSRLPSDLPDWLRAALGRAGDAPVPRRSPTGVAEITIVARPEDALAAVRTAASASSGRATIVISATPVGERRGTGASPARPSAARNQSGRSEGKRESRPDVISSPEPMTAGSSRGTSEIISARHGRSPNRLASCPPLSCESRARTALIAPIGSPEPSSQAFARARSSRSMPGARTSARLDAPPEIRNNSSSSAGVASTARSTAVPAVRLAAFGMGCPDSTISRRAIC
jgi:glycerate-2-kinase